MDYEKKLALAKEALESGSYDKETIEHIFPELKQSEDERIRKEILEFFQQFESEELRGVNISDWISWLEKQGKEEFALKSFKDEDVRKFMQYIEKQAKAYEFNLPNRSYDIYAFAKDILIWLEKQGESKSEQCRQEGDNIVTNEDGTHFNISQLERVAKKEPKFKVGDWISNRRYAKLIVGINSDWPHYMFNDGTSERIKDIDKKYHLWTIQDAKDGDVLCDGTTIFIFKDLLSDGSVMSYCDYDTDSGESDAFCPLSMNLMCSKITPVTKEQRETLFKAMHEAGYEWHVDKKELKKIEQKPAWSEEDDRHLSIAIQYVFQHGYLSTSDWLKSLKDRYTWKPSEEQMDALETATSSLQSTALESLYNELKKLKS